MNELVRGLAMLGAVVVVASLASLWWDRSRATEPHDDARRAARHAAYTSAAAVACLVGASFAAVGLFTASNADALGFSRGLGRLVATLPAAAGLMFVGAHAVGELTWPRPRGQVREAALVARTPSDVAQAWLVRWTWGVAGLTLATVLALALAADGPRSVARVLPDTRIFYAQPFPGTWFAVPVLVTSLLLVLASVATLRIITSRPAVAGTSPAWDMWLRRRSARRVLRGGQLVGCLTVAGLCQFAGRALRYLGDLDTSWNSVPHSPAYVGAGVAVGLLGVGVAVAGVVVAVLPARDPAPAVLEADRIAAAVAA